MRKLLSSIIISVGIAAGPTMGARVLTIDECCRMARDNYPSFARYGLIEATQQLSLSNVAMSWIPQVSVGAKASWQSQVTTLPDQLESILDQMGTSYPGMKHMQYSASVEVNQLIWDGGDLANKKAEVRSKAELAARTNDLALYDVEGRVQELYFSILLLERQINQIGLTEALLDSTLNKVRSMVGNGVMMPADADEIEAQLLTVRQNRVSVGSKKDSYLRVLSLFIGESTDSIELSEPRQALVASHGESRPQENLFSARELNLRVRERAVTSSLMPRIGAFVSASYGYPGMNIFKSMRSGNPDFGVVAGINLRWNISSFYNRSNSLKLIKNEMHDIEIERQTFEFNRQISIDGLTGEIRALRSVIDDDAKIAGLRTRVRQAAESRLLNGVISSTDLLDKITAEEDAELLRNVHIIQLLSKYYKLNHTINQ